MDVEQYLNDIRTQWVTIERLKRKIASVEESMLPSGIRYHAGRVQASPGDQIADKASIAVDLQRELLAAEIKYLTDSRHALDLIFTLEESILRQVLEVYYLSIPLASMTKTAQMVGYSREQAYRLRNKALSMLEASAAAGNQ